MFYKFQKRFDELEEKMIIIEGTKQINHNSMFRNSASVDEELLNKWRVNVKNLIVNSCGKESEHYKDFIESEKLINLDTSHKKFTRLKGVFLAAKEDYLGGYLLSIRDIVRAELFTDELEQAKDFLDKGYHVVAAVISGVVLETRIRELCKENNISVGEKDKLNKMNEDLAKCNVYNLNIQKQITALSGLRNSAAHGKTDEFSKDQVVDMIKQIETLLNSNFNI